MKLDASMYQKFIEKYLVSEAEIQENHEKNDSKNHVFFACVFKSILERFGEGFGRGLGPPWRLLGHF